MTGTDGAASTGAADGHGGTGRGTAAAGAGGAPAVTRRRALAGGVLAGGGIVLAGCGGEEGTAGTAPTTSATSSAAAPSETAPAPSSSGAAGGAVLAKLADVPVGSAVSVQAPDGRSVVVAQPTAGQVVGFDAACTHKGCPVAVQGEQLVCNCHGSLFEAATGKALKGPATAPLAPFAVRVDGDAVVPGP
ncbi:hypothetical protein NUM3379_03490 [Kineococcus sp. NUM-3379]